MYIYLLRINYIAYICTCIRDTRWTNVVCVGLAIGANVCQVCVRGLFRVSIV